MINHMRAIKLHVAKDERGECYISVTGHHNSQNGIDICSSKDEMAALHVAAMNLRLIAAKLDNIALFKNLCDDVEGDYNMNQGFDVS